MARKISAGFAGGSAVGGLSVTTTTITAADNLDVTVDPNGTGKFTIEGDTELKAQGVLRFADSDSSNYVGFRAPSTISSNVTWTLPATDGTANQVLTTDSTGTLSWSTAAVTISPQTSSGSTFFIPFTSTTSGTITSANIDNDATTGLSYVPSTGTLIFGTATVAGTVTSLLSENTKTTDYTLALADRNRVVNMNNASASTVTIPTNAAVPFPIGSVVYINRTGGGDVTLAASGGVTTNKTGTFASNEEIYVRKRDTNTWIVVDSAVRLSATGGTVSAAAGYTIRSFTSNGSIIVS